jgi:hypothetical protein
LPLHYAAMSVMLEAERPIEPRIAPDPLDSKSETVVFLMSADTSRRSLVRRRIQNHAMMSPSRRPRAWECSRQRRCLIARLGQPRRLSGLKARFTSGTSSATD